MDFAPNLNVFKIRISDTKSVMIVARHIGKWSFVICAMLMAVFVIVSKF